MKQLKVSQVIISTKDIEVLMKKAGIKSMKELARKAEINYVYLSNASNGKHILSQKYWEKIKRALKLI